MIDACMYSVTIILVFFVLQKICFHFCYPKFGSTVSHDKVPGERLSEELYN